MLQSAPVTTFVPSRSPAKSRSFYEGVLGLRFVSQDAFAMVLAAKDVTIRVADVSSVKGFKPAPYTILGWGVPDIEKAVTALEKKGVAFERYEGMQQDAKGVWSSPSGARIAWFKDTDGNILSITE